MSCFTPFLKISFPRDALRGTLTFSFRILCLVLLLFSKLASPETPHCFEWAALFALGHAGFEHLLVRLYKPHPCDGNLLNKCNLSHQLVSNCMFVQLLAWQNTTFFADTWSLWSTSETCLWTDEWDRNQLQNWHVLPCCCTTGVCVNWVMHLSAIAFYFVHSMHHKKTASIAVT